MNVWVVWACDQENSIDTSGTICLLNYLVITQVMYDTGVRATSNYRGE